MILLRVFLFFLVLLLLPDWYLYRYYLQHHTQNRIRKWFWIPSILLLLGMSCFVLGKESLISYRGTYLIATLCIAVPKTVFVLLDLIKTGIIRIFPHINRKKITKTWMIINLLTASLTCGYLLFGTLKGTEYFQVKEVIFESPDLPEDFDGYRILQLSDLHVGSWGNNTAPLQKAITICNQQQADLAVFTGDLVNSHADELLPFMQVLSELKAQDGVYSILGNHDYATYTHWEHEADRLANIDSLLLREKKIGWKMLRNAHQIIRCGKDSIALIGVENSGRPPFPDYADLPKAIQGTEGMFQILMSHDPTHWRREVLPHTDIQLMLAGHTHDMQISLCGFSISQFIYPEHNGLYREGTKGLYVNIGLGHVLFPMRLGAWPEITVITLRKTKI